MERATPSDLIKYLNDNNISTPATRTAILSSLKEAGVVSLDKKRKYQLDCRGIYFVSAYQFFKENNIELSIDLKKRNIVRTALSIFSKQKTDSSFTQSEIAWFVLLPAISRSFQVEMSNINIYISSESDLRMVGL